ncbi:MULTISPECIES: alpha/beta hydrolase [Pseudomonas aeruginosa group]|uniref:Alpha/beta hydrolase family protein n=1 Tax=Pseudomonas paraeruginosa TaxID=2994495 RepID=A0A2R3J025_9PSED|nr:MULTISPECIES: alpha/beta hydrolase [Pseudomonas aeruginosa group]AVK07509.1 alpha/beta hydrolase family protein [Pseudomonas paraeruginosa]KAB0742806.1 alpha/beta hydrolase [Pseudomonas aeruginosa]KPD25924.1 lipase [Pseudomonas paraeruginosa]KQB30213.1 lipase [Pseudomonas paraeruginosa]KSD71072.1 lipase [Pseudomonas aeruginosa]
MALNPDIAAYLELVGNGRSSGKSLPMHQLTVQQAREQFDQSSALMDPGLDEPLARVETLFVPARDGTSLPARLYSPQGLSASPSLPGVLYLHGGGYVVGSLDSHDALCASLAERAGCVVLSLAYRLAPEWRFPTAAEDVEDAWCWLAAEAERLGIDPQRLAVAGDSVGGSLCAVLSRQLALRGDASQPRLQVLIYPVTDASRTRQSIERYAVGHLLEKDSLEWFYQHYQRSPEDRQDPRFSPLLGVVPADLAPTLLLVAECDPLHDEGIAYAEHLRQGGAQVELCVYPGMTHDFLRMGAIVDEADEAKDMIAEALVAALAR